MSELHLALGDLHLGFGLVRREVERAGMPYLDWLFCEVYASVPSFSGHFSWNVMPKELLELSTGLRDLYDKFPNLGSTVEFKPTEPNIRLNFEIEQTGLVRGQYMLRDDFVSGSILQGSFTIEQNKLPDIARDIRGFVEKATAAV